MPNILNQIENDTMTDRALLAVSAATGWTLQMQAVDQYLVNQGIYRAGTWPRMNGNRYGNQPNVGLAAGA
jgi:hypothetical protein